MKPNVNMSLVSIATLCILLTGCQSNTNKPVELPKKVEAVQDVMIVEMEPDDQLDKALQAFAKNEFSQCAVDIKEAANSTRLIATSASQKRKVAIEKAAESLDKLADKVEKNEVKDVNQLYKAFGRTGRALAANRLTVTENEFFAHSEQNSGKLLSKTINQLEKSIITHHRALNLQEKQTINDALEVAARLEKGVKVDEDDLKAALQNIDNEIEKWNKEFESL